MEEYRVRVFLFKRVVAKSSFFTLATNNYQYGFYAFIYKCIPLPTSINIMSDLFIFVIIQLGFKGFILFSAFHFCSLYFCTYSVQDVIWRFYVGYLSMRLVSFFGLGKVLIKLCTPQLAISKLSTFASF